MHIKVDEDNLELHITLDLDEPTPSSTGKTLLVAQTHGPWRSSAEINGKKVWLIATAYIVPDPPKDLDEDGDQKKRQSKGKK